MVFILGSDYIFSALFRCLYVNATSKQCRKYVFRAVRPIR